VCRLNDIIVSVNGITTVGVTHAGAVDALKRAGYTVDMVSCALSHFSSELKYSFMCIHSLNGVIQYRAQIVMLE